MTQQVEQKAQLRNLSAEAALLGSLIVNPTALDVVSEHVGANDFSNPKNAAVYSAVCMAAIEGTTGLAAVVEQLRKGGQINEISENYLHALTKEACEVDQLKHHSAILLDLSRKRERISAANQVAQSLINGEDETLAFDKLLNATERNHITDDSTNIEDVMRNVINGNYKKTEPNLLRRSDGQYLLYSGKLNWLSAPPEAFKPWTMLLASVQEMHDYNRSVVYIDFEDDVVTVCERLYAVAVGQGYDNPKDLVMYWVAGPAYADGTRDHSKSLFQYKSQSKPFDMKLRSWALKHIKNGARLVTIDGCATAIALANLNENDNSDVNKWISAVAYPLTTEGAAVCVIDHVVKNASPGGGAFANRAPRGAGSKLAAVSGTALSFTVKEAASVYSEGRIELSIDKDRPGRVNVQKRSGKRIAGVLVAKPSNDGINEGLNLSILAADEIAQLAEQKRFDLVAAEHISKIVIEHGPISKTEVRRILKERAESKGSQGFRTETTVAAMKFLVDNGYVSVEKDSKTDMMTSLRKYESSLGDIHADDVEADPF